MWPGTRSPTPLHAKLRVLREQHACIYARWIDNWERKLATRDTNRVVRRLNGDWTGSAGSTFQPPRLRERRPREALDRFAQEALGDSDRFFSYRVPSDYQLREGHLTFTSPVETPYPENNTVHAQWFSGRALAAPAVLVLPQWNAGVDGHVGLAKLLNRFGASALRMSMAYHGRAHAGRVAARRLPRLEQCGPHHSRFTAIVIDARACLDWLAAQGYQRLAILGTSLGSCVAFIAAAHDSRIKLGIFNHVSMYFSDVVWTGLSTQHVRKGFGTDVSQDDLRRYWSPISPPLTWAAWRTARCPAC